MRNTIRVVILAALFCGSAPAGIPALAATVPQLVSYEGTLTNAAGQPVANGTYGVVFSIYSAPTSGSALWTESWTGGSPVTVTGGGFNVLLGSLTPIPASFFQDNPTTYLGVKVGADPEMLPRQRISSVAYSLASGDGMPRGGIIMWSGSVSTIPSGWVLCDGTNGTPDLRNRFVLGAGSTYTPGTAAGSTAKNLSHAHSGPSHNHRGYGNGGDLRAAVGIETGTTDQVAFYLIPALNPNGGAIPSANSNQDTAGQSAFSGWGGWVPVYGYTSSDGTGATGAGGSASQDIMPPYYALAFIMKL